MGKMDAAKPALSKILRRCNIIEVFTLGIVIAQHLVDNYGMNHFCSSIRATDLPVMELEMESSDARKIIAQECRLALQEDHADQDSMAHRAEFMSQPSVVFNTISFCDRCYFLTWF
jgi:allantoin racemase